MRSSSGNPIDGAGASLGTFDEQFSAMLKEWRDVEREIARRQRATAHKVASEWNCAIQSMTDTYLDLIARGLWTRGPSDVFNVIGIGRKEIRHSAMVAWLLDPLAPHRMGPKFLDAVLDCSFVKTDFDTSGLITIETEVARGDTIADIVVWGNGFTLIIETKVDAGEGVNQCDRLYERFGDEPGAVFLFLTPTGYQPKTATGNAATAFRTLSFSVMRGLLSELVFSGDLGFFEMGRATVHNYVHTLEGEFR